jgi:hypothetical protein
MHIGNHLYREKQRPGLADSPQVGNHVGKFDELIDMHDLLHTVFMHAGRRGLSHRGVLREIERASSSTEDAHCKPC